MDVILNASTQMLLFTDLIVVFIESVAVALADSMSTLILTLTMRPTLMRPQVYISRFEDIEDDIQIWVQTEEGAVM